MNSLYTRKQCVDALLQYRSERGEIPTRSGYMHWCVGKSVPSTKVIINHLSPGEPRWQRVLKEIGITKKQASNQRKAKHSSFTPDDCRAALTACKAALKHTPQQKQYEKWRKTNPSLPSAQTIVRQGNPNYPKKKSWMIALKTFGFCPNSIPARKKPSGGIPRTEDQIANILLQCSLELGEVPSSSSYDFWREQRAARGEDLPTQTTIRRRLSPEVNKWSDALVYVGLDPSQISSLSRKKRKERRTNECKSSLHKFVEIFGGLAPLSFYFRWSMLDEGRVSVNSILYWLTDGTKKWEDALAAAGLSDAPKLTTAAALAKKVKLPRVASASSCRRALVSYIKENGCRPCLNKYRIWALSRPNAPREHDIVYRFARDTWTWPRAIEVALNGEHSKTLTSSAA